MIKEHVNLKELKEVGKEIFEDIDYIEEYGHVGCFDINKEDVKNKSDKAIELIKQGLDYLIEIKTGIKNSYEY